MYLTTFDIFDQYFNRFGQYLVMYLVTGLKGLPGGKILFVTRPGLASTDLPRAVSTSDIVLGARGGG